MRRAVLLGCIANMTVAVSGLVLCFQLGSSCLRQQRWAGGRRRPHLLSCRTLIAVVASGSRAWLRYWRRRFPQRGGLYFRASALGVGVVLVFVWTRRDPCYPQLIRYPGRMRVMIFPSF